MDVEECATSGGLEMPRPDVVPYSAERPAQFTLVAIELDRALEASEQQ